MKITNSAETELCEVGHYEKELLGETTVYSLWLKRGESGLYYAVSVTRGEERESCYLPGGLFSSVEFFKKVVNGDVFPYTLSELIEDHGREWNAQQSLGA